MFQLNVSISAGIGSFVAARGWRVRCCCRSISAFLVHVEQRLWILECVLIMFAQSRNLKPILIKSFGSGFGQARPSPDLFWGPASKELFLHHFLLFYWNERKEKHLSRDCWAKTSKVSALDARIIHIGCCHNEQVIHHCSQNSSFNCCNRK